MEILIIFIVNEKKEQEFKFLGYIPALIVIVYGVLLNEIVVESYLITIGWKIDWKDNKNGK